MDESFKITKKQYKAIMKHKKKFPFKCFMNGKELKRGRDKDFLGPGTTVFFEIGSKE